jgi:hypothetical protein
MAVAKPPRDAHDALDARAKRIRDVTGEYVRARVGGDVREPHGSAGCASAFHSPAVRDDDPEGWRSVEYVSKVYDACANGHHEGVARVLRTVEMSAWLLRMNGSTKSQRTLRLQATSTMNTLFHSTLIAIERVRVRVRIVCCVFVEGER